MTKVLVTTKMMQNPALFSEFSRTADFMFVDPPQFLSEGECLALIEGIDIWICGDDMLTRHVAEQASKSLRLVIKWGAGFDSIDTEALADFGIDFRHTPGVLSNAVAEYALGLTLSLLRHIARSDHEVRSGKWVKNTGQELRGKTVGVVGYGSIGRAVGQVFDALGCTVIHSDPLSNYSVSLNRLLKDSQIVILCANLNDRTRGLLGASELSKMHPDTLIVNVARGELIDEDALTQALQAGNLKGAALDVFGSEPFRKGSALASLPMVVLSPHNASNTIEARSRANSLVFDILRNVINR